MFRKTVFYMVVLFFFISTLFGCQSNQVEEIYIVPHSINTKAYGGHASTTLYFASNKDIASASHMAINYSYDLLSSSLEDYKLSELTKVEKYQEYYIYRINLDLMGLDGGVNIYEILFKTDSNKEYRFDTHVYVSSDYEREKQIYGQVYEDGSGVSIIYGNYKEGIELPLKTGDAILIKDVYFEAKSLIDLTDYMQSIKINDETFNEEIYLSSEETFNLEIDFNSINDWNGYSVDILLASYWDEDRISTAYIFVPLYFGSPVIASRTLIDLTWGQSG